MFTLCLNLVTSFISFTYFNCLIYGFFLFLMSALETFDANIWRQTFDIDIWRWHLVLFIWMCPPKYIYWTSDCPFFFLGEWHQTRIPLTRWLQIPLEKLSFFSLANTCFKNSGCSLDLGQDPAYAGRQLCRMGKFGVETSCCLCPLSSGRLLGVGATKLLQDFSPGGWSSHVTSIASPVCRLNVWIME